MNSRQMGNWYEELAAAYLEQQGYQIIARQYRCRQGEIDLVARDGENIVFIEVKGRRSARFGLPQEAVDLRKQQRIRRVAQHFLWSNRQSESLCRFDVIAISSTGSGNHSIRHIEGAFSGC